MHILSSVGIIGGADGPTAVFVAGRFPWEIPALIAAGTIAIIWFLRRKHKNPPK